MRLDPEQITQIRSKLPLVEEGEVVWFLNQAGHQERNPRAHAIRLLLHCQRVREDARYQPRREERGDVERRKRKRITERNRAKIARQPWRISSLALAKAYGITVGEVMAIRKDVTGATCV